MLAANQRKKEVWWMGSRDLTRVFSQKGEFLFYWVKCSKVLFHQPSRIFPSGWSVLLSRKALKKASKQLKEMCPFHSDVPSILSACLVSMEPDPALRLFHDQVWPLTKFFLSVFFCKKNSWFLPGGQTNIPLSGTFLFFHSSQPTPPVKGPQPRLINCFRNFIDTRSPQQ